VTGKARELKLYLVDNTGTLPSVSPLKNSTTQHDEKKLPENSLASTIP